MTRQLLSPLPAATEEALRPLRDYLLARAREDARRTLAEATAQAERVVAEARAAAAEQVSRAGAAGREDARATAAREISLARRQAREIVLGARGAAYELLRRRVREEVGALRAAPDYPELLRGLTALVGDRAGPGAAPVEAPGGGARAECAGLRVDGSLEALADGAFAELGARIARLWEPEGAGSGDQGAPVGDGAKEASR